MMKPNQTMLCAGCKSSIKDNKFTKCTLNKCDKRFHLLCVGLEGPASDSWVCPDCRSTMRKGGDNSATPVRQSDNVTLRRLKPTTLLETTQIDAPSPSALSELADEIRLLRAEVSTMKSEFETAISALKQFDTRLDALANTVSAFDTRLNIAEGKADVVVELKREVDVLNDRLNSQAQTMLRNELEITGVTETQNENLHHTILMMSSLVGVKLNESDVDYVHRAGPRRNSGHSQPRPVVVKFTKRAPRDQLLKAIKVRKLTTKDIDIEGEPAKIYANERLTRANRLLFRDCRKQFKEAGFKFCWTSGGTIYVKKYEGKGKGSEALVVKSSADINRILQAGDASKRIHNTQ